MTWSERVLRALCLALVAWWAISLAGLDALARWLAGWGVALFGDGVLLCDECGQRRGNDEFGLLCGRCYLGDHWHPHDPRDCF